MPEELPSIVINTSPIIALSSALGKLDILSQLYSVVYVPKEARDELLAGKNDKIGVKELANAAFIRQIEEDQKIDPLMFATLDKGESAVLYYALTHQVSLVAIDEIAGRRFAKIYGIKFTGSLGILIKACQYGLIPNIEEPLENMRKFGIWLSDQLILQAIEISKKKKS